ncbi:PAS domain S-box protein [Flavobacterium sp. CF136]|uniref:PAS domain S-box protein n=1 Tax=Flavobacterium sp. (strain CF136) TaxID=1144313 RepID=UPI000271CA04|nr:PAS domain S-box protein [Flavobacterium sp. CF136]EJL61169.1 PAS domain S-box [Flavobacterium sp. CF136]
MQKNFPQYRILIFSSDVQEIEHMSELIHDRISSPKITIAANFKSVCKIISAFNFDVILVCINHTDSGIEILDFIEKNISRAGVIVISDIMAISEIVDSKNADNSANVFDYLPKSELSSLLLFKSVIYISEKNKFHIKLKNLERKYSNLFEMNPVPMWIYDLEFLKFWRVNDAAVRKYGYTKDEFKEMTLKDIRPKEDLVKLEKAVGMVRKHKKLFTNGIYRHKKKDGTIMYVEVVSNIIYIDKVKYGLVLANDITETLDYIQAIEDQNSKLQEIAFNHSHIIRAPLTNMMGILNLVKEMDLNTPESAELLEHLFTSCNQLDEKIAEVVKKSASYPLSKN